MTETKATVRATTPARATTGVLHCVQDDGEVGWAERVRRQSERRQGCCRRLLMRELVACELLAYVGDVPDGAAAVVGYVEAAVVAYGDAYGAAPDLAFGGYEAGEEVVVFAGGLAVLHGDDNDFVAGTVGAVPAAVFGGEGVTVVGRGKAPWGGLVFGGSSRDRRSSRGRAMWGWTKTSGVLTFGGHVDALAVPGFGVGQGVWRGWGWGRCRWRRVEGGAGLVSLPCSTRASRRSFHEGPRSREVGD